MLVQPHARACVSRRAADRRVYWSSPCGVRGLRAEKHLDMHVEFGGF